MMLDTLTIDSRRLSVDAPNRERVVPFGSALLQPPLSAGVLSRERFSLSYGPNTSVASSREFAGLQMIGSDGPYDLWEVPAADLVAAGMVEDTRVGTFVGQSYTAYAFFYRPMNRIEDVRAHFARIGIQESELGLVCPETFGIVTQRYEGALPEGGLSVSPPAGTPAVSYTEVPSGKVWVERSSMTNTTQVILETPELRMTIVPWSQETGGEATTGEVDAVAILYSSISAASWR